MAPLHFGCLVYDYQAIDVIGPTDLLNSASKRVMTVLKTFGPVDEETISRAPEFVFHHIGLTRDPVRLLTSAITVVPTTTVDECPELDCLLIGGPNVAFFELHPQYADFIRRHVAAGKLIFSTCTGASLIASTGVLDGKTATINNVEYEWVKKRFPQVNWTREKKWVVDGNIWTGSGAIAGMDMFSHWLKTNYGLDVLIQGALSLDYEPRDVDGLFTVFPQRYDASGKKISTHVFSYHD
ncbi:amidotransferase domain-containing protein [Pochonia chlamydosporia 170]|uniref:Amidotransferase domain-containing protein n=1 Tax=Pochonia chlamydosporia 170 TaxID=1380566 RepID=A0A179FV41_METCM|nr:amidotransferase domain-containing protein [Pochonia chlamydosporia 170]OAQ68859.1 amidotransferase domain-containing protein [Pochonia chlamydosporia 170]